VLGLVPSIVRGSRTAPDAKELPVLSPLLVVGSSLVLRAAIVFAAEAVRRA